MSWERQKSAVFEMPEEPSLSLWLMLGIASLVGSVLLFVLHANKLAGPLMSYNIWIITACPLLVWFFFLCLRGWIYNNACDRHQFETDEAEYAQQQWTAWAGRHIAILHSGVMLSDNLTPKLFLTSPPVLEQNTHLAKRLVLSDKAAHFPILLMGLENQLAKVPPDLPFGVTLLTDSRDEPATLQTFFAKAWQVFFSARPVPTLNIVTEKSFQSIEERIKTPLLDVELLLVQQTQGEETYSDALATLLLTSDDVATKYQFSHHSCLLRPMVLEPTQNLTEELDTFFSTQSQAIKTSAIVGDSMSWGSDFSALLASAKKYEGSWKPQQCHWLEKYAGLSGPFSPWILAAVVSDIVALTKEDCLMLSGDNERRYMNTVTTGNLMNGEG
ncbi:hypothetical protein VB265_08715 [Enterobacter sichuanensis]|uniref:hypothetical protein n=1 Tax=Enterobacter sichuanensis TaxID=2071710 RepID=UPI002B1F555E|nr:hypothetical protein [Enterobacter sichuanensis]MEA5169595.1 hypothetical protein [Enterobacter sichuanensis]